MNISAFCIKRPVFTVVISALLTLVGVLAYIHLPIQWVPNVSIPQVNIETVYAGANGQLVEHDVTKPIEDALAGINGIDTIESVSRMGLSDITINFQLGTNIDSAIENVRSHLQAIVGYLPKDVVMPSIMQNNPNEQPIIYLAFRDNQLDQQALSDYVDEFIKPTFDTLDGVGSVDALGINVSTLKINLDPNKMASQGVTANDVISSIDAQNISSASGQIRTPDRFYGVYLDTAFKNAAEFNNLILRDDNNQTVKLKDIGNAALTGAVTDSAFRVRGMPALALGIVPQSSANPLDIEKNVKKALADIQPTLPAGMEAEILYNQVDYIHASINSVYESLFEALFFVWVIIYLFLSRFKTTLIPMVTIPICVISTFAILQLFGFSINTITLMAFVLAIGLVVDDAIVVLENINRHRETGLDPVKAAFKGSREILFSVIVMTLTLAAVYTPIAFVPGLIGVLFKEFTLTLAGAVIISGVIAITLTPMMCARLLPPPAQSLEHDGWFARLFKQLQDKYEVALDLCFMHRKKILLSLLLVLGLGLLIVHFIPAELAPQEDMNEVDIYMGGPRSASFNYTDRAVKGIESALAGDANIKTYFAQIGGNSPSRAYQTIMLKPKNERKESTDAFMAKITDQLNNLTEMRSNVTTPMPPISQIISGDDGDRLGIVLTTTGDYSVLQTASQNMMSVLRKSPAFPRVENRLKWDSEQFQVNIDHSRAADLKVPVNDITNTLSTMIAGHYAGKMDESDIIVQMNEAGLANPNIIPSLYVRSQTGSLVSLGQLVTVTPMTSPALFFHEQRLRADIIYISLAPNFKLSDAIKTITAAAKQTLPPSVKFSFMGEAKSYLDSSGKTLLIFLLALIFIFLVLAAQFESFIDPLIILLTVPFAMIGALLVLWIFGGSLNIYSNIGLITLIGLIAKHGILITDFANEARRAGADVFTAVKQAALLRLRPILMTTGAMVLGAIPLAFATGAGAESREQIGLVIVGGMLFGTFFSLIVIPIMYTYLSPFRHMKPPVSE